MHYSPEQILKKIGLSQKESDIYLACLTYGGMTVTGLQRKSNLPRTTIYDTLQKLELGGYISKNKRENTLTFYAISIQELTVLMEDKVQHRTKKKQLLLDSTDQFQQLMQGTHIVPQVKLFQGEEALSHIFSQIKQSQTIRTIYSPETLDQYITKDKSTSVHKAHEQQKTHKKVLLVHDSKSNQEAKNLLRQGFEVKILPEGFPLHADIIVMDEKMYFLQYGNPMQAIEIIQPLFVNAQRALFDMIWESASTDSEGY